MQCKQCDNGTLLKLELVGSRPILKCEKCNYFYTPHKATESDVQKEAAEMVLPTPRELTARLDDYVIDQERAKRVLSVAVYNHYKRARSNLTKRSDEEADAKSDEVEFDKSNIIILGPTGCGKTLLAKTIAKTLNVPFAIADCQFLFKFRLSLACRLTLCSALHRHCFDASWVCWGGRRVCSLQTPAELRVRRRGG